MNIVTLLEMAADSFPDRTAVQCGDRRLTYAALLDGALAVAEDVRASGAEYLLLLDVNSLAAPLALFAAAAAGVPYVPLNYRLTTAELEELAERASPGLLIAGPDALHRLRPRRGLRVVAREAVLAAAAGPEARPELDQDPRAVAVQLFTSGTTGKPKAALLRHENLTSYILGSVEFAGAEEDDAALVAVPPYHIAGIAALLSSTYACRRIVLQEAFEPEGWIRLAREAAPSNAFVVPTMLSRIVELLDATGDTAGFPALRALAYGGGKMPQSVIERAVALMPAVDFTNAYGLTETSSTISLLGPDDHRAAAASADPAVRRRLSSVGRPLPSVELQVRDEAGRPLPWGQAGEVYVRGPQVAGEYAGIGSLLDADGWFPTRDRGLLDEDGYLFLEGRADDVIVRGGENISPGEIEEVLHAHPAVAEAAVVAVPDEEWGEGVGAVVVLKPGAGADSAALQEWVRARLRSSRVPEVVQFRDALPYNETGKLLRRVLRQDLARQPAAARR